MKESVVRFIYVSGVATLEQMEQVLPRTFQGVLSNRPDPVSFFGGGGATE
jgi:protein tyrosine phosphatase (PTP) superfamily phosphohydrolase (DUF442 family)